MASHTYQEHDTLCVCDSCLNKIPASWWDAPNIPESPVHFHNEGDKDVPSHQSDPTNLFHAMDLNGNSPSFTECEEQNRVEAPKLITHAPSSKQTSKSRARRQSSAVPRNPLNTYLKDALKLEISRYITDGGGANNSDKTQSPQVHDLQYVRGASANALVTSRASSFFCSGRFKKVELEKLVSANTNEYYTINVGKPWDDIRETLKDRSNDWTTQGSAIGRWSCCLKVTADAAVSASSIEGDPSVKSRDTIYVLKLKMNGSEVCQRAVDGVRSLPQQLYPDFVTQNPSDNTKGTPYVCFKANKSMYTSETACEAVTAYGTFPASITTFLTVTTTKANILKAKLGANSEETVE